MERDGSPGCLMPPRNWVIALVLGGGLFVGLLALINFSRPPRAPAGAVTAALTVIPSLGGTNTPSAAEILPTDILAETATLEPGVMGVGAFVQVSGTEGDGLRLRQGPGLGYEMQFLGLDGELFQIADGPEESDGYTWWFVVGSYDETRQGWAAADFLVLVPTP
jgi:hypothetical protein